MRKFGSVFAVAIIFLCADALVASGRNRAARAPLCTTVSNLLLDRDGDLATTGEPQTKCVEAMVMVFDLYSHPVVRYQVSGRTEWISVKDSIGEDCDDYNNNVFQLMLGGTDKNHDGLVREDRANLFCVGNPVAINGRYYYMDYAGVPDILPQDKILGYNDGLDDSPPSGH